MNRFFRCRLAAGLGLAFAGLVPTGGLAAQTTDLPLASFDSAWAVVYRTHFDTTFNGVDWPALRDSLRPAAVGVSRDSVRRLILAMLSRLGQSHFALIPQEMADSPTGGVGGGTAGFDTRLMGDRLLVTHLDPGGPADRAGVRLGWAVTAVDSNRVDTLLARVRRTRGRYSDEIRAVSLLDNWLQGTTGSAVTVHFLNGSDQPTSRSLTRADAPGTAVKFGDFPAVYAELTARAVGAAPGPRVGVIQFNTWMIPLMHQLDSAVDAFRRLDGIVLDLRGNRGGIGAMIGGVAGHFFTQRDTLGLFRTRTVHLAFAANPRRISVDGGPVKPFAGPVAILEDGVSASASEVFAGGMQSLHRARVFGTTSLGAVLPALWDRLPDGDLLYHAFADFITSQGVVLEGRGVIPDERVVTTRADLLAGRDPVLDAAVHWIAEERSRHPHGGTP